MSDGTPGRPVTELRATAHLMLLEPGLFCVFNKPGASLPDPESGLPGVRLSPAPGSSGGRIVLSGFGPNGWLTTTDDAALVRVTDAPAHLLVTVYQLMNNTHEPPQLQFLRLSEPPRAAAAPSSPEPTAPIEAVAHVYGIGDVPGRIGEWIGERGSRRWIEGFALQAVRFVAPEDLEYQAVLGRGWLSPWAEPGQFCGSRGMSLPILGLHVRVRGPSAEMFTAAVEATFVDGSAVGPVAEGACEAPSAAALEAFRVTLQPTPVAPERAPRRRRR